MALAGPTTAWAAGADTIAPELQSFSVSPLTVDTSAASKTITVTARISDADTGTAQNGGNFARFTSPSGQFVDASFYQSTRTSGTAQDGTYQATMTVPRGAEQGDWKVTWMLLTDAVGNQRTISAAQLQAAGFPAAFSNVVPPPIPPSGGEGAPSSAQPTKDTTTSDTTPSNPGIRAAPTTPPAIPPMQKLASFNGAVLLAPAPATVRPTEVGNSAPGINLNSGPISAGTIAATQPIKVAVKYSANLPSATKARSAALKQLTLGSRTMKLKAGQRAALTVKLPRAVRKRLGQVRKLTVKTVVQITNTSGTTTTTVRTTPFAVVSNRG